MRLSSVFSSVLDAILPRRTRSIVVDTLLPEHVPVTPIVHSHRGIRIVSLMQYEHPATEALIKALKYDGSARAAHVLSILLAEYLAEELSDSAVFSPHPPLVIPLPLHTARKRERGFNQISLVLSQLPPHMRKLVHDTSLVRIRNTTPQTRLSRRARLANMEHAFAIFSPQDVSGKRVILIDDVTTTGATLAEAAHTLASAGADVHALALAHA